MAEFKRGLAAPIRGDINAPSALPSQPEEQDPTFLGEIAKGTSQGIDNSQAALFSGLRAAGELGEDVFGENAITDYAQTTGIEGQQRNREEANQVQLAQSDVNQVDFRDATQVKNWVGGAIGTFVGSAAINAPAVVAGAAFGGGVGALAGIAGTAFPQHLGEVTDQVAEITNTREGAAQAAIPGAAFNSALDLLAPGAAFKQVGSGFGSVAKAAAKAGATAFGIEGTTEGLQGETGRVTGSILNPEYGAEFFDPSSELNAALKPERINTVATAGVGAGVTTGAAAGTARALQGGDALDNVMAKIGGTAANARDRARARFGEGIEEPAASLALDQQGTEIVSAVVKAIRDGGEDMGIIRDALNAQNLTPEQQNNILTRAKDPEYPIETILSDFNTPLGADETFALGDVTDSPGDLNDLETQQDAVNPLDAAEKPFTIASQEEAEISSIYKGGDGAQNDVWRSGALNKILGRDNTPDITEGIRELNASNPDFVHQRKSMLDETIDLAKQKHGSAPADINATLITEANRLLAETLSFADQDQNKRGQIQEHFDSFSKGTDTLGQAKKYLDEFSVAQRTTVVDNKAQGVVDGADFSSQDLESPAGLDMNRLLGVVNAAKLGKRPLQTAHTQDFTDSKGRVTKPTAATAAAIRDFSGSRKIIEVIANENELALSTGRQAVDEFSVMRRATTATKGSTTVAATKAAPEELLAVNLKALINRGMHSLPSSKAGGRFGIKRIREGFTEGFGALASKLDLDIVGDINQLGIPDDVVANIQTRANGSKDITYFGELLGKPKWEVRLNAAEKQLPLAEAELKTRAEESQAAYKKALATYNKQGKTGKEPQPYVGGITSQQRTIAGIKADIKKAKQQIKDPFKTDNKPATKIQEQTFDNPAGGARVGPGNTPFNPVDQAGLSTARDTDPRTAVDPDGNELNTIKQYADQIERSDRDANPESAANLIAQMESAGYTPDSFGKFDNWDQVFDSPLNVSGRNPTEVQRRAVDTKAQAKRKAERAAARTKPRAKAPKPKPKPKAAVSELATQIAALGGAFNAKDAKKAAGATAFIGEGAVGSSTYKYKRMAEKLGMLKAAYEFSDTVFVSTNGARKGRVKPVVDGKLVGEYQGIDTALAAGATLVLDNADNRNRSFNIGERELHEYLSKNPDYFYTDRKAGGFWDKKVAAKPKPKSDGKPKPKLRIKNPTSHKGQAGKGTKKVKTGDVFKVKSGDGKTRTVKATGVKDNGTVVITRVKDTTATTKNLDVNFRTERAKANIIKPDVAAKLRAAITKSQASQQKEVNRISKEIGVSGIKVNDQATNDTFLRQSKPEWQSQWATGALHGFTYIQGAAVHIAINPLLSAKNKLAVLHHEMGHAVYKTTLASAPTKAIDGIMKQFNTWRKKFKDKDVSALIKSKKSARGALLALADTIEGSKVSDLSAEMKEYALDFEEWFADNVSTWIDAPRTQQAKTAVGKFFQAIADALRKLFNMITGSIPQNNVHQYLDSLAKGTSRWTDKAVGYLDVIKKAMPSKSFGPEADAYINRVLGKSKPGDSALRHSQFGHLTEALTGKPISGIAHTALLSTFNTTGFFSTAELSVIGRAAQAPHVQRQLKEKLGHDRETLLELEDPAKAASYMYQLWTANQIKLGAQSKTLFGRLKRSVRKLLGIVSNSKNAEAVLTEFHNGSIAARGHMANGRSVVERYVTGSLGDTFHKQFGGLAETAYAPIKKLFYNADSRLRTTNNPALIQLADMIHLKAGRSSTAPTYETAKRSQLGRFENIILGIFEPHKDDAQFGRDVLDALQNPDVYARTNGEVLKIASKVRGVFREMHKYLKEAGVEIGDRGDSYFPWVMDLEQLTNNGDAFLELISQDKFRPALTTQAENINRIRMDFWDQGVIEALETKLKKEKYKGGLVQYRKDVASGKREDAELLSFDQVPEHIHSSMITTDGFAEIDPSQVKDKPALRFSKKRMLAYVSNLGDAKDRSDLAGFFQKDLGLTLNTYVAQSVKRAEYVRRFGEDGRKLADILDSAKTEFGASDKEIAIAENYVHAVMGTYGRETAEWLHKHLGLPLPEPGRPINATLQKVMGTVMVIKNMALLSLATLTSMADPIGIAVRTGDLSIAFNGMKDAIKSSYNIYKGNATELNDLATMLGVVDHALVNEALGWEYGGVYMEGRTRNWNETFFKYSGLSAWTRLTRVASLAGGRQFLRKHGTRPNKHSARYLDELGLNPEDVVLNPQGELKVLTRAERREASPKEVARDDRIRNALNQFVDESILRPNASQRPIWASDPHYMLIFHLKSFLYSFHDRILKRTFHETAEGNYMALANLMMFIPAMVAADFLRDLIKYLGEGAPRKTNWDFMDYVFSGMERSGMLGVLGTTVADLQSAIQFGDLSPSFVVGPTLDPLLSGQLRARDYMLGGNVVTNWFAADDQ